MKRRTLLLIVLVLGVAGLARGQQVLRRFEIGALMTAFRTRAQTQSCAACPKAQWSPGPVATFNLNQYLAIDGAFNFWSGPPGNPSWEVGGNLTQMLLGVKASLQASRFSLFGTFRPGYVRWSHGQVTGFTVSPDGSFLYSFGARTNLAMDIGGGLQYALRPKIGVRMEMSDTVIWWHRYGSNALDPPPLFGTVSSNLRFSSGLYYRFGGTIPVDRGSTTSTSHKFFDKLNLGLFSAGLLAQAADSITTQRRVGHCRNLQPVGHCAPSALEGNPLALPFVTRGWGGQIAGDVIVDAAHVSLAFALHKMGHHRIERFVTIPGTVLSAHAAYLNLQRQ